MFQEFSNKKEMGDFVRASTVLTSF